MAKKLTNKQKGYLAGAGALGLFLLYGGSAKASTPTPSSPKPSTGGGGSTGGASSTGGGSSSGGGSTGGGSTSTTLKKGSSGQAVREWQRKIAFVVTEKDPEVFYTSPWENPDTGEDWTEWGSDWKSFDDGQFGNTTKGMTRLFQGYHGLTADGVVGKNTRAKMSEVIASTGTSEDQIASTPLSSVPGGSYP